MAKKQDAEKEMFKEYEFKYEVEDEKGGVTKKSTTIKKWPLRKAGVNVRKSMGIFVKAKEQVPDLGMNTIIENIPLILSTGIEEVMDVIENTLKMSSAEKQEFMDNVEFDRIGELVEVIVNQNFLSPVFLATLKKYGLNFQANESED